MSWSKCLPKEQSAWGSFCPAPLPLHHLQEKGGSLRQHCSVLEHEPRGLDPRLGTSHIPCLVGGLSEAGTAVGDGWLLLREGLASRGPVAGGVGPLLFASEEEDSSCRRAGLGITCPGGLSGPTGICLGLEAFFMAGGVSGGVSGTRADIGGGGGEGSPSGEGLGSGGILAIIAERPTQERSEGQIVYLDHRFNTKLSPLPSGLIHLSGPVWTRH